MANPLSSVLKALGGGINSAKGISRVPKFGPTVAKPLSPSPMSVGSVKPSGATLGTQDMLSRAKRTREKGYRKTATKLGAGPGKMADLGAMPPMPSGGSSGSPTVG